MNRTNGTWRDLCAGMVAALLLVGLAQAQDRRNLTTRAGDAAGDLRVALVIGNSRYKEAALANPTNDASDMAKALQDVGFKVILRRDANTREMRQAIREFGADLRRAQVGLFYFAGHGIQVRGNNYLVPIGADIEGEADVEDLAIDTSYALRTMEESGVKVSVVILDACRNNPFARKFRSVSTGLAQMTAATGSVIAFATAPGSVAADGSGRNGVYTKNLLANLRQPDTDLLKVFQRTRAAVVKETGGRQTPWESTSLIGDFYFRPPAGGAQQVAAIPGQAAQPAIDSSAVEAAIELSHWESVRASPQAEMVESYLQKYPDGRFATLAKLRLKEMEPRPAPQKDAGAAFLEGFWEAQIPTNPFHMLIHWNPTTKQYEGTLTKLGRDAQFVGFVPGELIMKGKSTDNPNQLHISQMMKYGANGASTKSIWVDGVIYLDKSGPNELVTSFVRYRRAPGGSSPVEGAADGQPLEGKPKKLRKE